MNIADLPIGFWIVAAVIILGGLLWAMFGGKDD